MSGMQHNDLVLIANQKMPFGKYRGRRLIDLPEEYLLWFARTSSFPAGKLGQLMEITLMIKQDGTEALLYPLKNNDE